MGSPSRIGLTDRRPAGTVPLRMHLHELEFDFPRELIAQEPVEPRDSCRLMFVPGHGGLEHRRFWELPGLLRPGDTLVFNDSRVLPARVPARKPTGGHVELLFLHPAADLDGDGRGEAWEVLARPSHRLRPGGTLLLPGGEALTLLALLGEGRWVLRAQSGMSPLRLMETYGRLPLPPYIKTYPAQPESYQTVYASQPGSAAAPTAGLHFTPTLLRALEEAGVGAAYVTLHVGLDTFQPIREERVEDHRIHREAFSVSAECLHTLRAARARGDRLVAVGTTATRVLETLAGRGLLDAAAETPGGPDRSAGAGEGIDDHTEIFITPGYEFRGVDALLTNFHLPHSSVLALVMAFAGVKRIRDAYREAVERRYRFFSFGDAMLVEPGRSDDVSRMPGGYEEGVWRP